MKHVSRLGASAALLGAVWLGACTPPPEQPASTLIVPESYREAMHAEGHAQHVGVLESDSGERVVCRDCHDLDAEGFAKPRDAVCASCHEERTRLGHPLVDEQSQSVAEPTLACLSCHAFAGEPPDTVPWTMESDHLRHPQAAWLFDTEVLRAPQAQWTCLECHDEPQGDAVAVKVHGGACFLCHDPHRASMTEPTSCTVCHAIDLKHGAKGATLAETCMKCHAPHHNSREASDQCAVCHSKHRGDSRITTHALFDGHPSCGTCHEAHSFSERAVKPCASCHEELPVLAARAGAHEDCASCHRPHEPERGPVACQGACHQKLIATHPPEEAHAASGQSCTTCHPPHARYAEGRSARACSECHTLDYARHGKKADGSDVACASCHEGHRFALVRDNRRPCKECHATELAATALARRRGHRTCEDCHAGLPHQPAADQKPCLACHEQQQPAQHGHAEAGCRSCHEAHSGKLEKTCNDCHALAELAGLHREVKHQRCERCHVMHGPQPDPRGSCLTCHEAQRNHEPMAKRCASCHLFREPSGAPGRKRAPELP